jgi:serine protease inhibitor
MPRFSRPATNIFAAVLFATVPLAAQEGPGQALPNLVLGNERFGGKLLMQVHSTVPDRNVVVSPISLTIIFAALQSGLGNGPARTEIGNAFGWGAYPHLSVPARMLLAAFEKPESMPLRSKQTTRFNQQPPEGAWISNVFLYRGKDTISEQFVTAAHKYFGTDFTSTGSARPTAGDLGSAEKSTGAPSPISPENDIVIRSGSHLQTAWRGNTFSMSEPYKASFRTTSGELRQVEMFNTELKSYLYAKTDTFEAVVLPCDDGYMLAVLPAPGKSIQDVERGLAETPGSIDAALQKHIGIVSMPSFHFQFTADLRQQLEQIGIRSVFKDLAPIVKIPRSHLTQVAQKTEIQVDKEGIRANAETVAGAVYGGIVGAASAFHMELNRPFVFLIRDQTTNVLLFLGAVMDPM